jgi:hypothetical protein
MNDNFKIFFGTIIFFVIAWGISGLIDGKGFFTPTIEIIDSIGNQIGNLISSLIKIGLFVGIIWLTYLLFNKKS